MSRSFGTSVFCLLSSAVGLLVATPVFAQNTTGPLPTRETPIGRLTLKIAPESFTLSPDQRRLAFVAIAETAQEPTPVKGPKVTEPPPIDENKKRPPAKVWLDNKPHKTYAAITMPVFSPDSQKLAYAAEVGGVWKIVVDGNELPTELQGVPDAPVVFSPDSKRMAIIGKIKNNWHVLVDDKLSPPYEGIGNNTFTFSPDSQQFAYVIKEKNNWVHVINNTPNNTYTGFSNYAWSPDSKFVGIHAKQKDAWQIFASQFASAPQAGFSRNSPIFSPDARRVAFVAMNKADWRVGLADIAQPAQETLSDKLGPLFENTPAFINDKLYYLAMTKDKKWQLYIDHKPNGDPFPGVVPYSFTVSPDRKHFAFGVVNGPVSTVIRDGKAVGSFDELGVGTFSWSPDSSRLAFAGRKRDRWHVIADGYESPPTLSVGQAQVAFSPDGKTVAFTAQSEDKKWRLFVNDRFSKEVDAFARNSYVVLTPTHAQTVAVKNRIAVRLEVDVK